MGLDIGGLKEKYEKKQAQRADRFTIADGENYIRILPPSLEYLTESVDYISFEYLMHYRVGIGDEKTAVVCPRTYGKKEKCPICEAVSKLYKANTLDDIALAKELGAKRRIIYNILDLNHPDKGVQIMEQGPGIYKDIVVYVTNPKWGDLLDMDEGRNITLTKVPAKETGSGYPNYNVMPDPDKTSVRDKLPKEWKTAIARLEKSTPQAKSYDELQAILEGTETREDTAVRHEKTEVSDVERKEEKKETKKKPEPEPEEAKEPKEEKKSSGSKKECFGEGYGSKRAECQDCTDKKECRDKFLDM